MAEGFALVGFALAYAIGLMIIMFSLSHIAYKAYENDLLLDLILSLVAMVVIFFVAFAFAKFLFGF